MKIYLIKASGGSEFSKYKAKTGGPPQNIFSTAAATPKEHTIEMCDETIGMKTDFSSKAEIVAIFMSTPDAIRAYEIADKFRAMGRVVILGGLHTKFMESEAKSHADSLLIGEVEGIWEQLLADYQTGELKKRYERSEPLDLSHLNPYPTDLIPPSRYNYTWSVLVSRGCVHNCDFCLVPKFSGSYRFRPIEDIVDEVRGLKDLGVEWVELHSDTLTANRRYIMELFDALAPLNMKFYGETTILIANDEELLKSAQRGGVKALLFGIETPSKEALKEGGKGFVHPDKIKGYVSKIKEYGIEVWGDFLFGFDAHNTTIFQETLDFIKDIGVDQSFPHLIIPFPGSDTYDDMEKEGRILTKDWSKYEGSNSVFKPKGMTPDELEEGIAWVWSKQSILGALTGGYKKKVESERTPDKRGEGDQQWKIFRYWRSITAMVAIIIGLFLNLYWLWGLVFLAWVIIDIKNGETYLMDIVRRGEVPVLYWSIIIMWLFLSVTSLYSNPYEDNENKRNYYPDVVEVIDLDIDTKSELVLDSIKVDSRSNSPKLSETIEDSEMGFKLKIPKDWKVEKGESSGWNYFQISDSENSIHITLSGGDMGYDLPLKKIEKELEISIFEQFKYLDFSRREVVKYKPLDKFSSDEFKAYRVKGEYKNYKLEAINCYKKSDDFGYSLIAIIPAGSDESENIIKTIIENLTFLER